MSRVIKLLAIIAVLIVVGASAISCTCAPAPWDAPYWMWMGGMPFLWLPFGIVSLGLYFLPTIIAVARGKKSILGIVLLNVFAGWTFIGWIVALVWSLTGK